MARYNDIDMHKWKEYSDIYTDSLWIVEKRDNSGAHSGHYHGNFIPQIPHQLLTRYTKTGEWVLDPFMGSGTTLIEAQRLGRNSIGIELQSTVAEEAKNRIDTEAKKDVTANVIVGDSKTTNIAAILKEQGTQSVQFVIMHPPYWDIVKFSDNKDDLSNCKSLEDFLSDFSKVIDNTTNVLDSGRYCAVVIGDKYANSQIVPLGVHCTNLFLSKGFILKAVIIKNFEETKGKSNQHAIWRYRALNSDFYVFKHEYILVFKKKS